MKQEIRKSGATLRIFNPPRNAHQERKKTDYVKRQYIGNLGKIENGIVSVNAYGYCEGMTFPLKFKIFKPKERLKEGDKYRTKPELGAISQRTQRNGVQD